MTVMRPMTATFKKMWRFVTTMEERMNERPSVYYHAAHAEAPRPLTGAVNCTQAAPQALLPQRPAQGRSGRRAALPGPAAAPGSRRPDVHHGGVGVRKSAGRARCVAGAVQDSPLHSGLHSDLQALGLNNSSVLQMLMSRTKGRLSNPARILSLPAGGGHVAVHRPEARHLPVH